MQRKHVVLGLALLVGSGAAAYALLPNAGDWLLGNLPFAPEFVSAPGKDPAPGTTSEPQQTASLPQQQDPFSPINLPLGNAGLFVTGSGGPGAGDQPQDGGTQLSQAGNPGTDDGNQDDQDRLSSDGGDGDFPELAMLTNVTPSNGGILNGLGGPGGGGGGPGLSGGGPPGPGGGGDGPGGSGPGDGGPGGGGPGGSGPNVTPDGPKNDNPTNGGNPDTGRTIAVDEPSSLALLLLGGLALMVSRRTRADRRAA